MVYWQCSHSDGAQNLHVTPGSNEVAAAGSGVVVMATVLTLAKTICRQRGEGKEEDAGGLGLGPGVGDNWKGPWGISGCETSNISIG